MTIPRDKLLHLAAGAALAAAGLLLDSALLGALLCAAGAFGREAYNHKHGGLFDWADIAYTLAGGGAVLIVWTLITGHLPPQGLIP